jgi:hypothetical protein
MLFIHLLRPYKDLLNTTPSINISEQPMKSIRLFVICYFSTWSLLRISSEKVSYIFANLYKKCFLR